MRRAVKLQQERSTTMSDLMRKKTRAKDVLPNIHVHHTQSAEITHPPPGSDGVVQSAAA